ncbi:MAG: TIR domain-containing protein [Pseudomonadota bacterium]
MKDAPGEPDAAVTPAPTYRVFISYHHSDAAIAAALATHLARFARPWYRARAMRVFLDKNSLSTDASLGAAIERALADSEWLILIASPNSAGSEWVGHEIAWWLANRGTSKLIIARTGGVIEWRGIADTDFDWNVTTALSPLLRGRFAVEPLWADLAAAAATRRKSISNPVFRDAFLGVAAQIHGVSKDALWNKERVEYRTRLAFAALGATTIAALIWGVYRTDSVSMDRKENITSIQLGAKAFSVLPRDATLAAQIALVGVALRPSGIAASALRSAVARLAGEVAPRFEGASPGAVDIAFSPPATRLAVLSRDGAVALLDAATGRLLGTITAPAPFEARALAWGAGGTLAVGGAGGVRLWQLGEDAAFTGATGPERVVATDARVTALAFSADGTQLAAGLGDGSVRIVASASGEVSRSFVANRAAGVRAIAFGNDGTRLATGAEDGEAVLWQLADAAPVLRVRMAAPIASVDFNREGDSTLAKHMLAVADAGGALRVVDADTAVPAPGAAPALRAIDLKPGGGVSARFVQGRCLVRAGVAGPVTAEATLGFEPLFAFGRAAAGAAPRVAMAVGNVPAAAVRAGPARPGSSLFALLDATGSIAVYEQPLCGDAEAVCRFAPAWLMAPLHAEVRARWVPADVDLREPVTQPPGPACRALIERLLIPPKG